MKKILIKNGQIVSENETKPSDILISNGIITKIENQINESNCQIIDATEKLIFPGGIDVHTHMDLPTMNTHSSDNFLSGSKASLFGGITTIIDFANQTKGKTLKDAISIWEKKALNNSFCDYGFHVSITDVNDHTITEMEDNFKSKGITSFKTFFAYDNLKISTNDFSKIMNKAKQLKGIVTLHAESGKIINKLVKNFISTNQLSLKYHYLSHPDIAEVDAIEHACKLAKQINCPLYIVHLSSKKGLLKIIEFKNQGVQVYCETCPQYLLLNKDKYYSNDPIEQAKYILSPPLRTNEDQNALWQGLINNQIDTIATDHCPFTISQKKIGISDFRKVPNGISGVENRFELLYSEAVVKRKQSLQNFVKQNCSNPARIFGLWPKKGNIDIGFDADITILNPKKKWTIKSSTQHTNSDYNPYEGKDLTGKIETVLLRGEIMILNHFWKAKKPRGQYLKRKHFSI